VAIAVPLPVVTAQLPVLVSRAGGSTRDGHARLCVVGLQGGTPSQSKVKALTTAASHGHLDVINQYDGDVNAKDSDGYTPLHKAIVCGQYEAVRALLRVYDLDVEQESCGFTPLYAAAIRNGRRHNLLFRMTSLQAEVVLPVTPT
jgi:hypothetical protein